MTLVRILGESVERYASRPLMHLGDEAMTYAEFGRRVDGLGGGLGRLDVGLGDRVALVLPNGPEFVTSYFAVSNRGAIVVPLDPKLKPQEIQYILSDVGAKAVVTIAAIAPAIDSILGDVPTERVIVVDGEHSTVPESFETMCASGEALEVNREIISTNHAVYLYTSGTTGKPKGVILTHGNFVTNLKAVAQVFDFRSDDIFLTVLPLYHSFGHAICMLLPTMVGASIVPLPKFSPQQVLAEVQKRRLTVFAAVPTMYAMIAQYPEAGAYDLSSVRYCFSGGAALPGQVMRDFEKIFGVTILEGYGHTEASPVVFVNPSAERRRTGSVGVPIPTVEVKLVGEQGEHVGGAGEGELLVRGPSIMAGYYNLPGATEDVLDDGWLKMRDLFRRDEDGYFYLIDRLIDLIIVGGANVYPREVEEVLYTHNAVAEAAVIGVDDAVYGETIKAVVALKPGRTAEGGELLDHCAAQLATYKVPRTVEFKDQLPKTSTGKISKKELR